MQSNNNKRKPSTEDHSQIVKKTAVAVDDDIISKKVNKPSYYCLPRLSIEMHNQKITIPRVTVELILSYLFNEKDCTIENSDPLEMERIAKNAPLLSNYKRVCKAWKEWFDNSNIQKSINSIDTIKEKIDLLTSVILKTYNLSTLAYNKYPSILGGTTDDLSTLMRIAQSKQMLGYNWGSDHPRSYACLEIERSLFEGKMKSVERDVFEHRKRKKFFCSPCGEGIVYNHKGEIYSGKVIEKEAVGIGSGHIYDTNTGMLIYSGQFLDGKIHGTGSIYFSGGNYYEGQFIDSTPCGTGLFFWKKDLNYSPCSINWELPEDPTDIRKRMIRRTIGNLKNIKEYF